MWRRARGWTSGLFGAWEFSQADGCSPTVSFFSGSNGIPFSRLTWLLCLRQMPWLWGFGLKPTTVSLPSCFWHHEQKTGYWVCSFWGLMPRSGNADFELSDAGTLAEPLGAALPLQHNI